MPGNGAKRKAEPRKVKAGGKHKQAKKGKQWTKAQLDAQRVAKEQQEKQEEEPPEDNTKNSAIAINSSDEEVNPSKVRRWPAAGASLGRSPSFCVTRYERVLLVTLSCVNDEFRR